MPPDVMTADYNPGAGAPAAPPSLSDCALDQAISHASQALGTRQHIDGHWVFELEADATIPAEYVLLEHYLDRIDAQGEWAP